MGLDCSHDAFHGAYSAFNRFRQAVCQALGGSFPPHTTSLAHLEVEKPDDGSWYVPDEVTRETHPGLWAFLEHSDCDGIIAPEICKALADEMEALLPRLDAAGSGGGHIERAGGFGGVARQFIQGCRMASSRGEDLDFH